MMKMGEADGRSRNTHSNIPTRIRSLRRRIGNIGSAFHPFHLSSPISHPTNPTQHPTATTSVTIIGTLPHAYLVPASSSAKTRRIDAASMRTTPIRSRRRKDVRVKRERKRLRRFSGWAPGSEGRKSVGRKNIINAVAAAPAGALFCLLAAIYHTFSQFLIQGKGNYRNPLQQKHPSPSRLLINHTSK